MSATQASPTSTHRPTGRPATPALLDSFAVERILADVRAERERQDQQWGEQNHDDGTGPRVMPLLEFDELLYADDAADIAREQTELAAPATWRHILHEEVFEAFAEDQPRHLRSELVQLAAVAVAWVEAIDRRARRADGREQA